jgi:hypothetical protein
MRDAAGDWPISLDKAHYILSFEVMQARRRESLAIGALRSAISTGHAAARRLVSTGWDMFYQFTRREIAPYVFVETLGEQETEILEASHISEDYRDHTLPEFWRAATKGLGSIVRPYREDRLDRNSGHTTVQESGEVFSPRLLIQELVEFTEFAAGFASYFTNAFEINIYGTWLGLEGRVIADLRPGIHWEHRTSHTNRRSVGGTIPCQQTLEQKCEAVARLANEVLRLFDGLEVDGRFVENALPSFRSVPS